VFAVLKCHRLKNGSVASMTDQSSRAHGAEDATPQVAAFALRIAPAMLRHRRGIGHVYGNDCCGPSEENAVKRPSSQERRQRIDGKRLDLYLKMWMHCGYVALHRCHSRGQIAYSMGVNERNRDFSTGGMCLRRTTQHENSELLFKSLISRVLTRHFHGSYPPDQLQREKRQMGESLDHPLGQGRIDRTSRL
jgi:hypothetical protein